MKSFTSFWDMLLRLGRELKLGKPSDFAILVIALTVVVVLYEASFIIKSMGGFAKVQFSKLLHFNRAVSVILLIVSAGLWAYAFYPFYNGSELSDVSVQVMENLFITLPAFFTASLFYRTIVNFATAKAKRKAVKGYKGVKTGNNASRSNNQASNAKPKQRRTTSNLSSGERAIVIGKIIFNSILVLLGVGLVIIGRVDGIKTGAGLVLYDTMFSSANIGYTVLAWLLCLNIVIRIIKKGVIEGLTSPYTITETTIKEDDEVKDVYRTSDRGFVAAIPILISILICVIFAEWFLIFTTVMRLIALIKSIVYLKENKISVNRSESNQQSDENNSNSSNAQKQSSSVNYNNAVRVVPEYEYKNMVDMDNGISAALRFHDGKIRKCKKLGITKVDFKDGGEAIAIMVTPIELTEGLSTTVPYAFMIGMRDDQYVFYMCNEEERASAIANYDYRQYVDNITYMELSPIDFKRLSKTSAVGSSVRLRWRDGQAYESRVLDVITNDDEPGERYYLVASTSRATISNTSSKMLLDEESGAVSDTAIFVADKSPSGGYYAVIADNLPQETSKQIWDTYYYPDTENDIVGKVCDSSYAGLIKLTANNGGEYEFEKNFVTQYDGRYYAILSFAAKNDMAEEGQPVLFWIAKDKLIGVEDQSLCDAIYELYKEAVGQQ